MSITRVNHPCRSPAEFGEGGTEEEEQDNWYSKGLTKFKMGQKSIHLLSGTQLVGSGTFFVPEHVFLSDK
jgi:hypothetical protein